MRRAFVEVERLGTVESVGEAQLFIPFAIHQPAMGQPTRLAATPREAASAQGAAVLFGYEDPACGRLTILEEVGSKLTMVRAGIPAVVDEGGSGWLVRWVEDDVLFTLICERGARDEVLELVERI